MRFETRGEKIFYVINYILLTLFALTTLLPFMNLLAKSMSSNSEVISGAVTIYPKGFQMDAYKYVLKQGQFVNSFKVSIFVTIVGTFISMIMTVMTSYPLSKPHLKGRKFFLMLYIFAMLFGGGMVPTYLLVKSLNLINTVWSLILPGMISIFNMLIVKNYFEGLPESIEESAKIDGASDTTVLFRIVLPMALPVLATVSLFYAVGYWNNYMSAILYITKPNLKPLQQYLNDMIANAEAIREGIGGTGNIDPDQAMNLTTATITATTIIVSTVPILCVYPFLQKYFVKGITIGSVKG